MKTNNDQLQPYLLNPQKAVQAVKEENIPTIDMLVQQMQQCLMSDRDDIDKKIEVFDLVRKLMLPASHSYIRFVQGMMLPWLQTVIWPPEDLTQEDVWQAFFGLKPPISQNRVQKCRQLLESYKSFIVTMGNELPYEAYQEHLQPSLFNLISKNIENSSSKTWTQPEKSTFLNNLSEKSRDLLPAVAPLNNYVRNKLLNSLDRPEWIQQRQPATQTLNKILALLYTGDEHVIREVTDCLCELMEEDTGETVQIRALNFADSMYLLADPQIQYEFRRKLVPILLENLNSKSPPSESLRNRYMDSLSLYYSLSSVKNDEIWRMPPLKQLKNLDGNRIFDKNSKNRRLINEAKRRIWMKQTDPEVIGKFRRKIMDAQSDPKIEEMEPIVISVPSESNNSIKVDNDRQQNVWMNQNRLTFNPVSFSGAITNLVQPQQQTNIQASKAEPYFRQPKYQQIAPTPAVVVRPPVVTEYQPVQQVVQNVSSVHPINGNPNLHTSGGNTVIEAVSDPPTLKYTNEPPKLNRKGRQESHVFFSQSSDERPPKPRAYEVIAQVNPINNQESYVFVEKQEQLPLTPVKKYNLFKNVTPMRQPTGQSVATTQTNRYGLYESSVSGIQPGKTIEKPQFKIAQIYDNWNKTKKINESKDNELVTEERWYDGLCCRPKIEKMYEIQPSAEQNDRPSSYHVHRQPIILAPSQLPQNTAMSQSRFTGQNGTPQGSLNSPHNIVSANILEYTKNENQLLRSRLSMMKSSRRDLESINSPISQFINQPLKEIVATIYQPKLQRMSLGAKRRLFKNKEVLLSNSDIELGFVWKNQNSSVQPYEPGNITLSLYFTSSRHMILKMVILADNIIYTPTSPIVLELFPGRQERKNIDFKGIEGSFLKRPIVSLQIDGKTINLELPYTVLRLFHYEMVDNAVEFIGRFANPAPQHSIIVSPWTEYNKRLVTQPNILTQIIPEATLFTNEEGYFAYCQSHNGTLRYGAFMLMKMCRRVLLLVEFQMKKVRVWLLSEGSRPERQILYRVMDDVGNILAE